MPYKRRCGMWQAGWEVPVGDGHRDAHGPGHHHASVIIEKDLLLYASVVRYRTEIFNV